MNNSETKENKNFVDIADLPVEVLVNIFNFLPWLDKVHLLLVCKYFNIILNDEKFDKYFWQSESKEEMLVQTPTLSYKNLFFNEMKNSCFALVEIFGDNKNRINQISFDKLFDSAINFIPTVIMLHYKRVCDASKENGGLINHKGNLFHSLKDVTTALEKSNVAYEKYQFIFELSLPVSHVIKIINCMRHSTPFYAFREAYFLDEAKFKLLNSIIRIHPDIRYYNKVEAIDFKIQYKKELQKEFQIYFGNSTANSTSKNEKSNCLIM